MRRAAVWSGVLALVFASAGSVLGERGPRGGPSPASVGAAAGCLSCHAGIEEMHPEAELSCVDCHGGDPDARLKLEAHVRRPTRGRVDERVDAPDRNLAWHRFQNPMDLRVVGGTCGTCHEIEVEHLLASLHATTAGHLSDGYYEAGLWPRRGSRYSVFPVSSAPVPGGPGAPNRPRRVPASISRSSSPGSPAAVTKETSPAGFPLDA